MCYNRIWSWSPMPCEKHGPRASVTTKTSAFGLGFCLLTTRMHGDYRPSIDRFFVGFNAICYAFLRNNPIYIEGRNCSFSTVPVLFNKCSGLRPSDTLSSWWLGWRRHARVGKPFFGKSLDLYFRSFTIVSFTIYLYWIKGILRGYANRSGRRPEGSQRPQGGPHWLGYVVPWIHCPALRGFWSRFGGVCSLTYCNGNFRVTMVSEPFNVIL